MASSFSSLITCISSAMNHLGTSYAVLELKIELRNLQALLVICSRKLGDDLPSRFSAIEAAIARIRLQEVPSDSKSDYDTYFKEWINRDALPEVRGLAKQVTDECYTSPLAVEDVVAVADFVLKNAADFWALVSRFRWHRLFLKVDLIDAFVAQVTFLKCLLVLAKVAGAELQHLMVHFQPFAINAARVFIRDEPAIAMLRDWYEEVNFKCSAAIGIATAPQVYEAYTQALTTSTLSSITPAGILENYLDSLVSLLWDVLRHHLDSRVKDQLKVLYEKLRFCRCILKRKPGCFDGEIKARIGVLICGAGMLVCSLHHTHIELSYPDRLQELLQRLGVLQAQVENSSSESTSPTADELGSADSAHIMENIIISDYNEEAATYGHTPQRSSSAPQVADFQDDEVNSVLDRLMRGSKQLQIVPICGMAGLGKTTFTSSLYNHRSIIYHFQSRAWCLVSQVLDKRRVMLQLLSQLNQNYGSYSDMTDDDIANKLRQSLKGRRYLIVLDDVWTTEAWHSLAVSFPDDSTQSRVVITSRHHDIVSHAPLNQQPYLLRLREDNECLEILQRQLPHKKGWTSELGLPIAKMCKGLPLMAVIVAGLQVDTTKQQGWKGILDHLSCSGVSDEKQCNNALELSFTHLPDDLKLCFLYFAAFPEDEEITVKRLLRLWIGEGFVRESKSKRIEDVAREYMEHLIRKSLVMVVRNRSIGGVKTCRIHDSVFDFCLRKSKQENFFHILLQRDAELSGFNEPPNLQRLIIHSDPYHAKEAMLFCPRAHSMLLFSTTKSYFFDVSFIIQIFKLLNVLDVYGSSFTTGIPSEIELLTRLRYLSIRSNLNVIPPSIGNLLNLETLILEFWDCGVVPFPYTFWNLHKLKWLSIKGPGFSLPTKNLENSCALLELESLCGVVFYSYGSMEQQMRKFPNILRLKCKILHGGESTHSNKIVVPGFLNQVQRLTISGYHQLRCEFGSSETLRRLSLDGFELSREEIADIGKLPNLEVLKLQDIDFRGDTLDMEFPKLKYLTLDSIRIKRLTVSDEQLPCLQKLILDRFHVLEEITAGCLMTSATLEEIQVRNCSPNMEAFVREIQTTQGDYGNLVHVDITYGNVEY